MITKPASVAFISETSFVGKLGCTSISEMTIAGDSRPSIKGYSRRFPFYVQMKDCPIP